MSASLGLRKSSRSALETRRWGRRLGRCLRAGDVVLLSGNLGAGKTTFVQGVVRALGVHEQAVSPTFIIAQTFEGRIPVHHLDFYRLNKKEILALGIQDYLSGTGEIPLGVTLVEWAKKFPELWPKDRIEVQITIDRKSAHRTLRFQFKGARYQHAKTLFGH